MKLANNIKYFPAYEASNNMQIMAPIYALMLMSKGLNFAEIMMVQSAYTLTCTFLDVFSGCLSDRIGRKRILIIGQILATLALGLWIPLDGFIPALLLKIVYGAGLTFKNGADISLLYETLKYMKKEKEYEKVKGKSDSYMYIIGAIECILAGFLFGIDRNLPLVIATILSIINLGCIIMFEETKQSDEKCRIKFLSELKLDTRYVMSNKSIIKLIVGSSIYYFLIRVNFIHFAPYLKELGFKVEYMGILYFVVNIIAAFITKHNEEIYNKFEEKTVSMLHLVILISCILFVTKNIYFVMLGIIIHQSFRSVYANAIDLELNQIVDNDKRAAIMSYKSMSTNLSYAIVAPIFGFMAENNTTHRMYEIYLITGAVAFIFYGIIFYKRKNNKILTNH